MEQWKTVEIDGVTYKDYEVSTKGRIRNVKTGRILKQQKTKIGYLQIGLPKDKKKKWFLVHRLVATAFIPNPHGLTDVDHIDKNRQNNCVENLRWLSHENNLPDSLKQRRVKCVETGMIYKSIEQASKETGISQGRICEVCKGKCKTTHGFHWEYVD